MLIVRLAELHEIDQMKLSALNLSTLGDAGCKFIDAKRRRSGIVGAPLGDRPPSWKGQRPDFERNQNRLAIFFGAKRLVPSRLFISRAGSECTR
jgi:hypothetical protein